MLFMGVYGRYEDLWFLVFLKQQTLMKGVEALHFFSPCSHFIPSVSMNSSAKTAAACHFLLISE